MVLDVYVEGCNERFSCAYRGFPIFKCEILRGWNEELGRLYKENSKYLWTNDNLTQKSKKILEEYDKPYNEGMKLFIHPCNEFNYTPAECELLLAVFERVDPDKFNNYNKNDNKWYKKFQEKFY